MDDWRARYWQGKLAASREALESRGFDAFVVGDRNQARRLVIEEILPGTGAKTVSWGDSMTLHATGILDILLTSTELSVVKTFEAGIPRAEIIERRRRALLVDFFITGTNAVTESGELVNLDMVGNRAAAITFGPKTVVIVIGRNKIVPDVAAAMSRIKDYSAPINAIRHEFKTPCARTSRCADCKSGQRLCNTWTITKGSFPKGRIKVILINEDLGL
ncbi:MAG TPA: lactate utilization protein [Syntrophales bacterium]|nr:lactate utilization protein [Syntrophales bacterium]